MKKKLFLMAAALGVCACTLLGCRTKPLFDAGEELGAEELAALRASMQSGEAEKQPVTDELPSTSDEDDAQIFYFVENGGVYHRERDCAYLKKSNNVRKGNAAAVAAAGKTRLCSACGKDASSVPKDDAPAQDEEEICYYTQSGETWHFDRWCASLKNSKNVIAGTVGEALGAGKSRPCSRCGD